MGSRRTGLVVLATIAVVAVAVVVASRFVEEDPPDTRPAARTLAAPADVAGGALGLGWSADGSRLLVVDTTGVTVRNAADGTVLVRIDSALTVATAAWTTDRSRVALADAAGTTEVWDATTGTALAWSAPPGVARAWRPDGAQLAVASADGTVVVLDAATGATASTIARTAPDTVLDVAWLDDARVLVTTVAGIEVWDVAAGTAGIAVTLGDVARSAPSPDGTRVAVGRSGSSRHAVVTVADGSISDTVETTSTTATALAWSPDGRWLFVMGDDDRPRLWDAEAEVTRDEYPDTTPSPDGATWSPDSRLVAMADLDEHLVAAEGVVSGDTTRLGVGDAASPVSAIAWSPDGALLAAVLADGTVDVWDVDDLS